MNEIPGDTGFACSVYRFERTISVRSKIIRNSMFFRIKVCILDQKDSPPGFPDYSILLLPDENDWALKNKQENKDSRLKSLSVI
jgi:hypothetical protein